MGGPAHRTDESTLEPGQPVPSPDGQQWFALVREGTEEADRLQLEIGADAHGRTYRSALTWAGWFAIRGCWDGAGRVWISSSDIGVNVFVCDESGWRRYAWDISSPAQGRPPMIDVRTGETVSWIDALPPEGLGYERPDAST